MNKSLRLEAVIVFYLVVQSAYVWIERSIFWGEILLVVLFFYGIREKYTYMKHHTVFLVFLIYFSCVLPFIAWTIGSLHGDFNFLYSLRHLTYFFYGAFAIFSFINAHKIVYILGRAVPIMTLFVLYVPDPPRDLFFGLTLVGFAANPHLRRFWIVFAFYFIFTRFFTVGLSPLDISRGESSSDFVIGILETIIIALAFFGRRAWLYGSGKIRNLRILIVSGFVVLLIFYSSLAFIANQSNLFHAKGYSEIEVTYSLSNDNNTVWRMAYWGAMLSRLIDNPMGIGIGRPFLPLGVGDGLFYFGQENS
ncbi:MAG TPA: hypothetical protein HPQ00_11285, partial [Magnetococcales bacterium]|nr:hypothetical protein [Magnetococcales bacterium]